MAGRVYVHIGLPKTGTTFLQTAMWNNRQHLRRQAFLYPGPNRTAHYHASRIVRGGAPDADGDAWQQIVGELAGWHGTGLISHEFFSMATAEQASAAVRELQPAEVQVVVTVRDYVRQFPAVWQEAVKMGSDTTFDDFMEKAFAHQLTGAWGWNSQDVPAVLRRWSQAVSPDRVHVITVPPPGAPRQLLWQRWCEVLGIDDSDFDMGASFGNESLGAPQAALARRMKPYLSGPLTRAPERHRWLRQYFGHEVLGPQRGPRFGLRPEDAATLRQMSVSLTHDLAQGGYSVTGNLAELVPAEDQPLLPHPDDVTDAELLEVALRAMEQMVRDVRGLTHERNRLRRARPRGPLGAPRAAAARAAGALRRRMTR